jgi:DNA-binding transcriptional ArsR family regulator
MPNLDARRSRATLDERRTTAVELAWSPTDELALSLIAFALRGAHAVLELGPDWVRAVRRTLPPSFPFHLLHGPRAVYTKQTSPLVLSLVRHSPRNADPAAFIDWLAGLAPGELYDHLCAVTCEDVRLPRDLAGFRDGLVELLGSWHTSYFRTVDPAILDGLAREVERRRPLVGRLAPVDLVEQLTNGVWLAELRPTERVVLVPQYHSRPTNHDEFERDTYLIWYPADVLPSKADAPSPMLRRLTRALADDSRLRILRFLADGPPRTLTEVARHVGLSQPTVHHHLILLRAAGLTRTSVGRAGPSRYELRPNVVDAVGRQLRDFLAPNRDTRS